MVVGPNDRAAPTDAARHKPTHPEPRRTTVSCKSSRWLVDAASGGWYFGVREVGGSLVKFSRRIR
jgi:hypothetical protein